MSGWGIHPSSECCCGCRAVAREKPLALQLHPASCEAHYSDSKATPQEQTQSDSLLALTSRHVINKEEKGSKARLHDGTADPVLGEAHELQQPLPLDLDDRHQQRPQQPKHPQRLVQQPLRILHWEKRFGR